MRKRLFTMSLVFILSLCFAFFPGRMNILASEIVEVSFGDLVMDGKENWQGNQVYDNAPEGVIVFDGNRLELHPNEIKHASNILHQYENIHLRVTLTVTWPGTALDWGSIITLRDKGGVDPVWVMGRGNCYAFVHFLHDEETSFLQISRYNWDDRAAGVPDRSDLFEILIEDMEMNGVSRDWEFIVYDSEEGVVIEVYIDGVEYGRVVDDSEFAIKGAGYVGITHHGPRWLIAEGEVSAGYSPPEVAAQDPIGENAIGDADAEEPAPTPTTEPTPEPTPSPTPEQTTVENENPTEATEPINEDDKSNIMVWVIIAGAVVFAAVICIVIINKKKSDKIV